MSKWMIAILPFLFACTARSDTSKGKQAIQQLLRFERDAHVANDVDAFLNNFADTVVSVNRGDIHSSSLAESRDRFTPYFNSVTFSKWDDFAEPIIDISDDGSMAYAAIEKTVVLTYPDSLGNPLYDSANYAWVSIYKKLDGQWKLVCNASTMEDQVGR
jgi:ketosteroid isomerase-like protein